MFNRRVNNSKQNFLVFNIKFVTRKSKTRSLPIDLVTQSETFYFFNFELVTRKCKNKSLTTELVTWSEFYFSASS